MKNKTVAVHQPNYLPWIGFFRKLYLSDIFVFLDDAQYPKNSYCNRVRIIDQKGSRWLTIPVNANFGDPINRVCPASVDWPHRHLDTMRHYYRDASKFSSIWPRLLEIYSGIPQSNIAVINRYLIENFCAELLLNCRFACSSDIPTAGTSSDDRLVEIVTHLAPEGTYISGTGAKKYQDESKFVQAGLKLRYNDWEFQPYPQRNLEFVPGLSIVDAVFSLGWKGTGDLIRRSRHL